MKYIEIVNTPSFFLGERSSHNTCHRENRASLYSPVKGWVRFGTLVTALVSWVVLVACPAAPSRQVALGEATRIGTEVSFGAREDSPYDLAAIDTTLYMVGALFDVLYTLNIDPDDMTPDGMAIQVGSTTAGFGVGESFPTGLAAIGNTLYMVGQVNDTLYVLNTTSGGATQVGATSVSQFDVSEDEPTGLASINDTLYMVGNTNDALYALDTNSGGATRVGATGVVNFGVDESFPTGLAAIGNTLYMVGWNTDALYTVDTTTGRATRVSDTSVSQFGVNEDSPRGLAAIGSILYMVGETNDALFVLRYQ